MVNVLHNMVVFPKLTAFVFSHCKDFLTIDNSKESGRHLSELLVDAFLSDKEDELPDISIYYVNERRWKDLYVPSESRRKIRVKSNQYTYSPELMSKERLSLALSFLQLRSDARINLLNADLEKRKATI